MRILFDTNIFIPIEPASPADIAPNTSLCLELVKLCNDLGHQTLIHPLVHTDLSRDRDSDRRSLRSIMAERYRSLETIVPVPERWKAIIGDPDPHSNDWVDHHLLSAVGCDAVYILVTEDLGIRKKARRLGISDRVWSLTKALETFRVLSDQPIDPIPNLRMLYLYQVNESDPIFDSLRRDYEAASFDAWLRKSKQEGRQSLIINDHADPTKIAGIVVLKSEDCVPGIRGGKTLKLCTFKVGEQYGRNRYGELLLKGVFDYVAKNDYELSYFTAYERQEELLGFSESFGFRLSPERNSRGEVIAYKDFNPSPADIQRLNPWDFYICFGPPKTKAVQANAYIIPIEPRFFRQLFPEVDGQQSILAPRPCGNGIKKAYLCNAKIRDIPRGSTLFFYQSHMGDLSGIYRLVQEGRLRGCLPGRRGMRFKFKDVEALTLETELPYAKAMENLDAFITSQIR